MKHIHWTKWDQSLTPEEPHRPYLASQFQRRRSWRFSQGCYLCMELWPPPFCRGGLCGTWHGSGGTRRRAAVWRRATAVWRRPHSLRESGRAWEWTRGLCGEGSWFCRLEEPRLLPLGLSGLLPRWHKGSRDELGQHIVIMLLCFYFCIFYQPRNSGTRSMANLLYKYSILKFKV